MRKLSLKSSVPRWRTFGRHRIPASVDLSCPHCGRQTNMQLQGLNQDEAKAVTLAQGRCPACGANTVFVISTKQSQRGNATECDGLFAHPDPNGLREQLPGAEWLPEDVRHAYGAVVDVVNAKVWKAAEVCCNRVLESILLDLLPEHYRKDSQDQQLHALPSSVDLGKPLARLADAVQKTRAPHGGGSDSEPNEELARISVDLVEQMMEYLYVLPGRIEALHAKLEALHAVAEVPESEEEFGLDPADTAGNSLAS